MISRLSTQLSGVALTARSRVASGAVALAAVIAASSGTCLAAPQFSLLSPLTTASPTAVASALFAGRTGAASMSDDTVEVRDAEGVLLASVTSARIAALMPWATFGGSGDGPVALAMSDSGRLVFIAVATAAASPDALPSGGIIRYDTFTNQLTLYARIVATAAAPPAMVHTGGLIYVATDGRLSWYRAQRNDSTGLLLGSQVRDLQAIAVDREGALLFALDRQDVSGNARLLRGPLSGGAITWTQIATVARGRSLAWSDSFGAFGQNGLFVLNDATVAAPTGAVVRSPAGFVRTGTSAFLSAYATPPAAARAITATSDGRLLLVDAASSTVRSLRDDADTRLGLRPWMQDEFKQVVRLCRGLISPDGEPAGWVIDGDVVPGSTRFHPATPDAAAWCVFVLLANDALGYDTAAGTPGLSRSQVRAVLTRYAGLAPDGIVPSRTADGIFRHWIGPLTGQAKSGWDPEFATLSTMKMVMAAQRAARMYPDDVEILHAARVITCGVRNWDRYFRSPNFEIAFKGLIGGGPDTGSWSGGWNEGVMFADLTGFYSTASNAALARSKWFNSFAWPTGTYVTGRPAVSNGGGSFLPAFITAYPAVLVPSFRADLLWRQHTDNVMLSHAAWTDDNSPRWYTVFAAGVSPSGYAADSITNSTDRVTSFPALHALAGTPRFCGTLAVPAWVLTTAEASAGYNAYRRGQRQTFKTGASFLNRRSSVQPAFNPGDAGLPDVVMGALGLAELLMPGVLAQSTATEYGRCPGCLADVASDSLDTVSNPNGSVGSEDLDAFIAAFIASSGAVADVASDSLDTTYNPNGSVGAEDLDAFISSFIAGC